MTSISSLFRSLKSLPVLTTMEVNYQPIADDVISWAIGNVTTLTFVGATIDFSKTRLDFSLMASLDYLSLRPTTTTWSTELENAINSVRTGISSLLVSATFLDSRLMQRFPSLVTTQIEMAPMGYFNLADLPVTLLTFTLGNLPDNVTTLNFSNYISIRTFTLRGASKLQTISSWPPSAVTVEVSNCSALFSLPSLPSTVTTFTLAKLPLFSGFNTAFFNGTINYMTITDCPLISALPPNLASSTMYSLSLTNVGIIDPLQLCNLPASSLQSIIVSSYADMYSKSPLPFASCLSSFSALRYVTMSNIGNASQAAIEHLPPTISDLNLRNWTLGVSAAMNWTALVQSFPTLQSLKISNTNIGGTFPTQISALTSLGTLILENNGFSGTVPADAFASLSVLSYLSIGSNSLTGAVPTNFTSSLFQTYLAHSNRFTWFPDPPTHLTSLRSFKLQDNSLTSLPSAEAWGNMTNLVYLSLANNPLTSKPLPTFWANLPSLYYIDLSGCGFTGTIPTILSPQIIQLNLASNQLCGPLPELPNHSGLLLEWAIFSNNGLSGTIPSSWNSVAFEKLDVSSNHLSGDFSLNAVTSSLGSQQYLTNLLVKGNYFYGSMPNMNTMYALSQFDASNTLISLCAANPHFPSTVSSCISSNMPNGGSCICESYYSSCDASAQSCTTGAYTPRSTTGYDTCGAVANTTSIPIIQQCDPAT